MRRQQMSSRQVISTDRGPTLTLSLEAEVRSEAEFAVSVSTLAEWTDCS